MGIDMIQYITLRDQGFYEPFDAARRGVNNLLGIYNTYKPGGTEDERRARLKLAEDESARRSAREDRADRALENREKREQKLFDIGEQTRTEAKAKAATPGYIGLEALAYPGLEDPAGASGPAPRPFYGELPAEQQQSLVNKYGMDPAAIAKIYDPAVTSSTGRIPAPAPLTALPVTVDDPTKASTPLGYQVGDRFIPAPKTETPTAPPVFPVQVNDPTTGKPLNLGWQVGNQLVRPPQAEETPGITLREEIDDGTSVSRLITPAEYDRMAADKRQREIMTNPAVQSYLEALSAYQLDPEGGKTLGIFGKSNTDRLAQARASLGAGGIAEADIPGAPTARPAADSSLPTVTTQAQFDALPSGAQYIEDGQVYRKP